MTDCCPSNELLTRLLDEQLAVDELTPIEQHLEVCEQCQQSLEKLTYERFSASDWRMAGLARSDDPSTQPARDAAAGVNLTEASLLVPDLLAEPGSRRKRLILESSSRQPSSLRAFDDERPGNAVGGGAFPYPPQIQGYDILGRLGRGGMGIVYRARQHGLDRLVALKMLRGGDHADQESLARFRIEVRAVARLRHQNVVQVYDVGESQGLPYVSLELLEGGSLEARIGGTPQPEKAAAGLVATLARAIASAHEAGIVHRDLKSANVLFSRDGIPKITDFGLAKRLDEEDGQTQSGQVMGSPSFMAPEQARGEGHEVGPASDVYSLGAILYEMLAGRPPFKGGSPLETLHQVVHVEPVPPSKLRPELSRDLETICLKSLSKEPSQRYRTADEMGDDLDRFLVGSPITARRVHAIERAWKWARREPAVATLAATAAVALLVVIGLFWRRAETARIHFAEIDHLRAQWPQVELQATAELRTERWNEGRDIVNRYLHATASRPELHDVQTRAESLLRQIRGAEDTQIRRAAARAHLARFFQEYQQAQLIDAQWLLASQQAESDPCPVRRAAEQALELVGRVTRDQTGAPLSWRRDPPSPGQDEADQPKLDLACRELVMLWVEALGQVGPHENARDQARRALAILDQFEASRPISKAACSIRSALAARMGDFESAERARLQGDSILAIDAFDRIVVGRRRQQTGDWSGAIAEYHAALRLDASQFRAQLALAVCQIRTGEPEAAQVGLTACLQREPRSIDLLLLRGLASGEVANRLRRAEPTRGKAARQDAEVWFNAAEGDFQTVADLNPNPRQQMALLINRGIVRTCAARIADAEIDFAEAVRREPNQVTARINWGQTLVQLGRIDEAIHQFTRAIESDPNRPEIYRARALASLDHRAPAEVASAQRAVEDLDRAIRLHRPGTLDVADDYARRARLKHRAGDFTAALADSDEALRIKPGQTDATLIRIQTLLELRRYPDVIQACNRALIQRPDSAELWELRGVARSDCQEFAAAVGDLTQALSLDPDRLSARNQRGWAYLVSEASKLALADFDAAIALAPDHPEAYGGRGFALAMSGQNRAAIADAEESLRKSGQSDSRLLYNAARIYARAAETVVVHPTGRTVGSPAALAEEYQARALNLIQQAVDHLPRERRLPFTRDVVQSDPALAGVRQRPQFIRLVGQLGRPTQ